MIANALTLPYELHVLATHTTINFPWGSLLQGLLGGDTRLLTSLTSLARLRARIDVRLNGGALNEAGWLLEAGTARVRQVLLDAGFAMQTPIATNAHDLRRLPDGARRLAFGRDPRAMTLSGTRFVQERDT